MYIFLHRYCEKCEKKCPQSLLGPLIQIIIDETRKVCKKMPTACGFNPADNAYEPLKLMQTVMSITNDICQRYLDNSMLCSLPPPGHPHNIVSVCAAKNKRRQMEDRHVVIHDLNTIFNIQEATPSSYYAIFDGHAGHDAAAYSAAHLHQYLAESKHFIANPEQALYDAFFKTDALFIDKCNVERFSSGTTAVCALLRPKEKTLYIAWVGDSQALLVNQGRVLQCVEPHKPCRQDERSRIEKEGGYVCHWGTWRVNGQLAVSRAIGDSEYKPYVIAVPDIREIPLDGGEDFLILACDGLWDFLSEDDAARAVYQLVSQCPDKTNLIGEHLVQLSKKRGSTDNISVIVVFLREPSKIAAEAHWANRNGSPITMDTSLDNANNPFVNSNGTENNIIPQKADGLLLNLSESFKQNGGGDLTSPGGDFFHHENSNGKRTASDFDDDDEDLGPETDVDTVDDVLSPSIVAAKALAEGIVNNNPDGSFNPFVEKQEVEKAAFEIDDLDLQKQQSSEFDGERSPREETPTPPADAVHDGGLEENIADSGEESEDEWNYIKGEEANKENQDPSQPDREVADLLEEEVIDDSEENMSQLNPNAAEFVPVSPTRSIPSPACRALINDPVLAQSPKKPSDIDISLPNPLDFENEVKSRPSDVDNCSNGHDNEDDQKSPNQDLMENLLNGKNIDEIPEFQPGQTPTKVATATSDEFHFGPNAAPFTPAKLLDQSEAALSTRAVYGDESSAILDSTFETSLMGGRDTMDFTTAIKGKEDDPMSMSFYQDKDDTSSTDPFDLNRVQVLPENLDDFLNKQDSETIPQHEGISGLPEHDSNVGLTNDVVIQDNDQRIQTTDLDKLVDDEKELASPVSNDEELLCELSKSPNPPTEADLIEPFECSQRKDALPDVVCLRPQSSESSSRPESQLSGQDVDIVQQSPREEVASPQQQFVEGTPIESPVDGPEIVQKSPEPQEELCNLAKSPELEAFSPEPSEELCELAKSPESPTPEPIGDVCSLPKSPELPAGDFCSLPKSPEPVKVATPEPEMVIITPEPEQSVQVEDVCKFEEKRETPVESPVEDVTSSIKDVSSPITSPIPDQQTTNLQDDNSIVIEASFDDNQLNFAHEINNPIQENIPVEASLPISNDTLIPEACPFIPTSQTNVETADINSFLDKSETSEVTSPLSPSSGQPSIHDETPLDLDHPLMKCVYPLPTDIKTENIAPEFAEAAIISPTTEPSKEEEKPTVQEKVEEPVVTAAAVEPIAAVAAVAGVAAVAATAAVVAPEKKPIKKTSIGAKKPAAAAAKPSAASPTKAKAAPIAKARPLSSTATKSTTTTTAHRPTATTGAVPKAAAKPAPKPRTTTTTTTTRTSLTDKKPLTNGDVKTGLKPSLSPRKPLSSPKTATAPKPTAPPKPAPITRPSPTKPPVPRPTTAPAKPAAGTAAPKPRPTTLSKVGTAPKPATTTTTTARLAKSTTSPKTLSSPPKPRPVTAPTKPRVPLNKTVNLTTDAEKQHKESANKLTASRTVTSTRTTAARTGTASTVRKIESKTSGATRTTVTKTTTTTTRATGIGKKPLEITRNVSKTKTTKIEKPIQNGVAAVVTEEITVVNNAVNESEPQLVKDNSPIDNKLIVDTNAAD